jgi:HK97 gp10 family phage protein
MANEIEALIKDLGKVPKDLKRQLRPGLRAAGNIVADDAKRRAAWSTRIPRAIRVSITFSGSRPGVAVVVNQRKAPHARVYENAGQEGTFRHPVFGRDVWVTQKARPFLFPALSANVRESLAEIGDVVDRVTREAGFR